jgi:hypothetical protein
MLQILKFVIYIYVACVATGICIAQHESSLSTTAINRANTDGSVDNGIFQVSSKLFYSKETKSLVSIEKTPHAWSMDSIQKFVTAQL